MRNYPHLKLRGLPGHCVYAYGLNLTEEDFYEKHDFFHSNDLVMSDLINDDMLSSLEVYYGKVEGCDSIARGICFCVNKLKSGGGSGRVKSVLGKRLWGESLQLVSREKMRIDIILLSKSRSFILFCKESPFGFLFTMCL